MTLVSSDSISMGVARPDSRSSSMTSSTSSACEPIAASEASRARHLEGKCQFLIHERHEKNSPVIISRVSCFL